MILLIFGVNDNFKISHYKQFLEVPQTPDSENNCHHHLMNIIPDKQRGDNDACLCLLYIPHCAPSEVEIGKEALKKRPCVLNVHFFTKDLSS